MGRFKATDSRSNLGGETMLYLPREEGQGLVEYALILVLIAIIVIVILRVLGQKVSTTFSQISSGLGG